MMVTCTYHPVLHLLFWQKTFLHNMDSRLLLGQCENRAHHIQAWFSLCQLQQIVYFFHGKRIRLCFIIIGSLMLQNAYSIVSQSIMDIVHLEIIFYILSLGRHFIILYYCYSSNSAELSKFTVLVHSEMPIINMIL